ncbi:MAG: O-methyltransferase [Bacteroidetes bacterium]|nr:O-methyltransferase [Bacteroidota bacterium]
MHEAIEKYIINHTTPESEVLMRLNRETHLRVLNPRMLSGQVQGKFLEMISRMIQPDTILEIGTYTGYSAICLANGLRNGGILHTIEINPELEKIASAYITDSGYKAVIRQHIGDAMQIIGSLEEIFDLVFIDADKENYLRYYQLVFDKIRAGGFILADNALWDGKVVESDMQADKETRGIREFNDFVRDDSRVENVLLSFRDGIMLIRKL